MWLVAEDDLWKMLTRETMNCIRWDGLVEQFFTKLLSVIFYEKANSFEKTILPITEGRISLRSRQKWNMAFRLLSRDLRTCPYSEVKKGLNFISSILNLLTAMESISSKIKHAVFWKKVSISRSLVFSFQWVLSKLAGLESVPLLNLGNAKG